MGAKTSKGSFNRQAEARQSQKKSYQKFRQSIGKLTKEVNKVKIQNKEKLLELEIAIKSATNEVEIAKTCTEPEFAQVFEDFLKKCGDLDKIVKAKLEENDRKLEEIQRPESPPQSTEAIEEQEEVINTYLDPENAVFAEDVAQPDDKEDKKKNKKSKDKKKQKSKDKNDVNSITTEQEVVEEPPTSPKKDKKKKKDNQVEDTISNNTLDLDEPDKPSTSKKRFWSLLLKNDTDIDVNSITTVQEVVEEPPTSPKKDKKKKKDKQVEDTISNNTLDLDEPDKPSTIKKRFWSFPMRLKRKPSTALSNPPPETPEPLIIIQDPENEDRSLQNIEINQLEKAIKIKTSDKASKRRSKARSKFFDDVPPPPTPSSTPVEQPFIQQQDSLQQIHNIRMSITTLEEMTKIYRLAKRGNYDYIYDNLNLCVNKLKDMEQEPNLGMLTLRHEKKLAMQQAQECLDVLEGKVEMPDRFHQLEEFERSSGSFPQVVIARTPSKRRENYQKSVEFIDITNNDEVIEFSFEDSKDSREDSQLPRDLDGLEDSSDLSEDDDLRDILMNLRDSTEDIAPEKTEPMKPLLITSF